MQFFVLLHAERKTQELSYLVYFLNNVLVKRVIIIAPNNNSIDIAIWLSGEKGLALPCPTVIMVKKL